MKEKTNYGNWVPEKMLYLMFGLAAVFLVITVAAKAVLHKPVIAIVLGALCILSLLYAVYMLICHEIFAFGKGNMMAGVHEHLVDHLKWNGEGKLLESSVREMRGSRELQIRSLSGKVMLQNWIFRTERLMLQ